MQKNELIFGLRVIIEAITSNKTIDKVFLQKGLKGELIWFWNFDKIWFFLSLITQMVKVKIKNSSFQILKFT